MDEILIPINIYLYKGTVFNRNILCSIEIEHGKILETPTQLINLINAINLEKLQIVNGFFKCQRLFLNSNFSNRVDFPWGHKSMTFIEKWYFSDPTLPPCH